MIMILIMFALTLLSSKKVEGSPYSCIVRDCQDVKDLGFSASGVYNIIPKGMYSGYDVYCDMSTDYGGWLVFQRRMDGSEDFNRSLDEYVIGFGNPSGEYWLGNQALKAILSQGQYELQIELTYETYFAQVINATANYGIFDIGKYSDNYKLSIGVPTRHIHAAAFLYHDGAEFSTGDIASNSSNCPTKHTGGWWFKNCQTVNLNGLYGISTTEGISWTYDTQDFIITATEMKIRRL